MAKESPKYTKSELDTVLSENGPMPAAKLIIRAQAFVLDFIFISLFAYILIWQLIIPRIFPEAPIELEKWSRDFIEWFGSDGFEQGKPFPTWSEAFKNTMMYAQLLMFLTYWLYFAIGEVFFHGYSFGKAICRLRTISTLSMKKPLFFSAIARSGIKALALLSPVIFVLTIAVVGFNKRKQMGHDLLSRTAVIDERYLSSVDQIR